MACCRAVTILLAGPARRLVAPRHRQIDGRNNADGDPAATDVLSCSGSQRALSGRRNGDRDRLRVVETMDGPLLQIEGADHHRLI